MVLVEDLVLVVILSNVVQLQMVMRVVLLDVILPADAMCKI